MVEWLQHSRTGLKVDRVIVAQSDPIHAPHLIDIEVVDAIRRHLRLGALTDRRAQQAFWDLIHVPCVRHEHYPFLPRIWELRNNVSPYDAVYIALTEFLGAKLLTCDGGLAAAPGHKARIVYVS
jgi:predicted nucleic acid-binding protein